MRNIIIACICAFALMAAVSAVDATVQMADSISVPNVVCEASETLYIPINVTNVQNGPIQAIVFDLEYDEQTINITAAIAGDLTPAADGWQHQLGSNGESVTIATSVKDNAIPNGSSGSIVVLNCSFIGDAGESTWVNISDLDISNTALQHGTTGTINGSVTANRPPAKPASPSPSDAAPSVSLSTNLSWTCSDPDGDDVTYDVCFCSCSSNPPKICSNQSLTTYDVSLDYGTTYYWKIVAWDEHGAKNESEVWQFTTVSPPQHTLTTDVEPSGSGTVSLSPSGGTYEEGTTVTVTATPSSGYQFDHWDGDVSGSSTSVDVTMDSDKMVTAHFTEIVEEYTLTTSVDPSGSGSISLSPSGGTYDEGTVVSVIASPASGYQFDYWSGDVSGTSSSVDVTMSEDKAIVAHFSTEPSPPPENQPPTVSLAAPAAGSTVNGTVTVEGTASDSDGSVESVEVKIDDGTWQTASGTESWTYDWDTTTENNGNHTVKARSYDGEDYSDVASVTVEVFNNHPPSVSITSPEDEAMVNGTINITGTASDIDGNERLQIPEIQIEHDGGIITWMPVNGTTSWNYTWNTTEHNDGEFTIKVRAFDGHTFSDTASITLTVDNKKEDGGDGTPGFQFVLLLTAAFIALTVLRRKRDT